MAANPNEHVRTGKCVASGKKTRRSFTLHYDGEHYVIPEQIRF
jgi:hypothetical protein